MRRDDDRRGRRRDDDPGHDRGLVLGVRTDLHAIADEGRHLPEAPAPTDGQRQDPTSQAEVERGRSAPAASARARRRANHAPDRSGFPTVAGRRRQTASAETGRGSTGCERSRRRRPGCSAPSRPAWLMPATSSATAISNGSTAEAHTVASGDVPWVAKSMLVLDTPEPLVHIDGHRCSGRLQRVGHAGTHGCTPIDSRAASTRSSYSSP